jgi:hypothetical protein
VTLTIDRVDANGATTSAKEETITGVVSGSNLVSCVRGVEGTAQAHDAGAVVELLFSNKIWNDFIDGMMHEHQQDGTHGTLDAPVFESPNIVTGINDTNDKELFKVTATTSAVNEFTVANAAANGQPTLSATGDDAKISPVIKGKEAFLTASGLYDCGTVGAAETVSWKNGDRQKLTLDVNVTITFSDAVAGQTLTLYMLQDGSGTNTITFADTITWANASTPGWTTTASKYNIAVIFYDGSGYYGVGNAFA